MIPYRKRSCSDQFAILSEGVYSFVPYSEHSDPNRRDNEQSIAPLLKQPWSLQVAHNVYETWLRCE